MSRSWANQMKKGLAELCVLMIVSQEETYGYEILTKLRAHEGLSFSESTLYPVLAQLTEKEFLTVRSVKSAKGPARRYYRLTRAGEGRLEDLKAEWRAIQSGVEAIARLGGGA